MRGEREGERKHSKVKVLIPLGLELGLHRRGVSDARRDHVVMKEREKWGKAIPHLLL